VQGTAPFPSFVSPSSPDDRSRKQGPSPPGKRVLVFCGMNVRLRVDTGVFVTRVSGNPPNHPCWDWTHSRLGPVDTVHGACRHFSGAICMATLCRRLGVSSPSAHAGVEMQKGVLTPAHHHHTQQRGNRLSLPGTHAIAMERQRAAMVMNEGEPRERHTRPERYTSGE